MLYLQCNSFIILPLYSQIICLSPFFILIHPILLSFIAFIYSGIQKSETTYPL